jgi:hypothetical protein
MQDKRRNAMLTRKSVFAMILGTLVISGNAFAQSQSDYGSSPQQGQQWQAPGPSRVPPDSAISACSGKSEGTACVVTGPNGSKQGVCAYTPDKKYYACKPNDMNKLESMPQR